MLFVLDNGQYTLCHMKHPMPLLTVLQLWAIKDTSLVAHSTDGAFCAATQTSNPLPGSVGKDQESTPLT